MLKQYTILLLFCLCAAHSAATSLSLRDCMEYAIAHSAKMEIQRATINQFRAVAQRYKVVMWSILTRDYNRAVSPKSCLRGAIRDLRGGDIVSLHDSAKSFRNMSYALPAILRKAREKGLTCKILEL